MAYTLSKAFDLAQQARAVELLAWGVREHWSTTALQTRLQREDLGYRREVLIKDYERAQVISLSKTDEARARATHFYETVYQPFKAEHELNTMQMGDIMSAYKRGQEVSEELQEAADDYNDEMEMLGS